MPDSVECQRIYSMGNDWRLIIMEANRMIVKPGDADLLTVYQNGRYQSGTDWVKEFQNKMLWLRNHVEM